jgi:hypothetical protein
LEVTFDLAYGVRGGFKRFFGEVMSIEAYTADKALANSSAG